MNLLLHGIGKASGNERIEVRDALAEVPGRRATLVLANPPFGRRSGFTSVDDAGRVTREDNAYNRPDFWKNTTNEQLNFVQHIFTLLDTDGRAAVVLPDNVLFEEVRARRSVGGCSSSATSTRCCGSRPGSSTRAGSRPTCCSSTSGRP